jgi:5,10-methenyltetrahydrofolate synthetase
MNTTPPSAKHAGDTRAYRAELRSACIAARLALPTGQHAALSQRIAAALLGFLAPLPAACIAFCAPVRSEFDAGPVVEQLLARGWTAAMPVVEQPAAPMAFRPWTPQVAMVEDRHGIPIPGGGSAVRPDVVLLPLVAFDAAGYRLGYGGGYFDRTLAALAPSPLAVGVGFELARVADIRPQAHDRKLDAIVTEAGVFRP